jgi:hypothetical protein
MTAEERRPYGSRIRDAFRVPHPWLLLATWLVGQVAVHLLLGGPHGGLLWSLAPFVPVLAGGIALASASMDPYAEWDRHGRPWRVAALTALGTGTLAVALTVALRGDFLP